MSISARRLQAAASFSGANNLLPVSKLLVIMEENHSLSEMESGMPYLYSLSQTYGYATNYAAITHPSLPNYIAITGGSTFGISDDNGPSSNAAKVGNATSVFGQALAAGKTAKLYAETMASNNEQSNDGAYAVRHNPWAYFGGESSLANKYDVPMASNFSADVANNSLPNAGMLIPNVDDDAHDGTLAQADSWLQAYLPSVLGSADFTSGKLVVVITADEDDGSHGNIVLTTVLHASLSGKIVSSPLSHYSLTGYYAHIYGTEPLLNGASAPAFAAAFGL